VTLQTFPSQSIRDVEARHVKQAACGAFAIVTVDFEPKQYGFELAIPNNVRFDFGDDGDDQDYRFVFGCLDALVEGITEELGKRQDLDVRTRVLLRRIRFHAVDSNEMSFRHAGRMLAWTALERFTATTPSATTPSAAPSHPTTG
jgi:hypothetical protein